jgi:hypothetical protein
MEFSPPISELLRPTKPEPNIYCIRDYPGNLFGVRVRIDLIWDHTFREWKYEDCSHTMLASWFEKYPHLFIFTNSILPPSDESPSPSETGGGFRLSDVDVKKLLDAGLKPEEIGGNAEIQQRRIRELVRWFVRFADKSANPKWAISHAFELAYYIATNSGNRFIDLHEIEQRAFLEGVNLLPEQRAIIQKFNPSATGSGVEKKEEEKLPPEGYISTGTELPGTHYPNGSGAELVFNDRAPIEEKEEKSGCTKPNCDCIEQYEEKHGEPPKYGYPCLHPDPRFKEQLEAKKMQPKSTPTPGEQEVPTEVLEWLRLESLGYTHRNASNSTGMSAHDFRVGAIAMYHKLQSALSHQLSLKESCLQTIEDQRKKREKLEAQLSEANAKIKNLEDWIRSH